MAETLSTLSIISFVIAGIGLAAAVFFWFFFSIPEVIGDLSGRNAKKSIAKMRSSNEKTGNKEYRPSETNASRGKLTGRIFNSEKKKQSSQKKKNNTDNKLPETGLLSENKATFAGESTVLLNDTEGTELLNDEAGTAILDNEEGTALLDETPKSAEKRVSRIKLTMLDEVEIVNTDEVI